MRRVLQIGNSAQSSQSGLLVNTSERAPNVSNNASFTAAPTTPNRGVGVVGESVAGLHHSPHSTPLNAKISSAPPGLPPPPGFAAPGTDRTMLGGMIESSQSLLNGVVDDKPPQTALGPQAQLDLERRQQQQHTYQLEQQRQQQQQQQFQQQQQQHMQQLRLQQLQQQQLQYSMQQQQMAQGLPQHIYSYGASTVYPQMQAVTTASGYSGVIPTYVIQTPANMGIPGMSLTAPVSLNTGAPVLQSHYPGMVVHAAPAQYNIPYQSYVTYEYEQQPTFVQEIQHMGDDRQRHAHTVPFHTNEESQYFRNGNNADTRHAPNRLVSYSSPPPGFSPEQRPVKQYVPQSQARPVQQQLPPQTGRAIGGQGQYTGPAVNYVSEREVEGVGLQDLRSAHTERPRADHDQEQQALMSAKPIQQIHPTQDISYQGKQESRDQAEAQQVVQTNSTPQKTQQNSRPPALFRITRNQQGVINVFYQIRKDTPEVPLDVDGTVLKPGTYMEIEWQLPLEQFTGPQARDADFVLGLVRYGAGTNAPGIVTKGVGRLGRNVIRTRDMFGNEIVKGKVQFHAPKSAGAFVYRLFDNQTKEKSMYTLGTSTAFIVELGDVDITVNLRHALDSFLDGAHTRGLTQFNSTIKGLRSPGKPMQGDHPQVLLQKCMWAVFDVLEGSIAVLEKAKDKETQKEQKIESADTQDGRADVSPIKGETDLLAKIAREQRELLDARAKVRDDEEFWSSVRSASRLQTDLRDAITYVSDNRIAWSMLTEAQRAYCLSAEKRYCRVLHRHFRTDELMRAEWVEVFGFLPALTTVDSGNRQDSATGETTNVMPLFGLRKTDANLFDRKIRELLPKLLPSDDFDSIRESARRRVEDAICKGNATMNILPPETIVQLYGSSRNHFGSDHSDLDFCLMLPPGHEIPVEEKPIVIELVGASLRQAGMQVQPRPTARIPIVQFVEPESGLDCDVSLNNPLALCNTKLLRSYSECDPRVRPLAYIIKHWAKMRQMNNPGDGTLSSYGYILMLIHFLQVCQPPVLPNLQRIPPDWQGGTIDPVSAGTAAEYGFDIELNPVDGTPCRTYFFQPQSEKAIAALHNYGARNNCSIAELLVHFFKYYAYEFDFRGCVVSIEAGRTITKVSKAELDGWPLHERVSIEDPFERSYDVGHVVKTSQMIHIQKEFLRAYTLICRTNDHKTNVRVDGLPAAVKAGDLLGLITAEIQEVPKFIQENREMREKQEQARRESKLEQDREDMLRFQMQAGGDRGMRERR